MDRLNSLLICVLAGFAVSYGIIGCILRVTCRRQSASRHAKFFHTGRPDHPPVPRCGGIALAAAVVVLGCLPVNFLPGLPSDPMRWVIIGTALAMFGLGLWDDLRTLDVKWHLAGQLIIASAAYFLGLGIHHFKIPLADRIIDLGNYSWPVTVFWLAVLTNLINFIDQADGLAGGIALMLMLLLAVVGVGTEIVSVIAAGLTGALVAFLRFNFPPAKIYLGNSGAYFVGFLIGGLTIYSSHKGTVVAALVAPLFVLALPVLDATLAVLRRGLHGLPFSHPDRRRLHHRLLQSGLSRRDLALGAYVFTAFFLGLALVAYWWRGQYLGLVLGAATVLLLLTASRFGFSRHWFNVSAVVGKSLKAREEIQYALDQARWLAMEGARGSNLQSICEDTALIARKLGFARLLIRLEDGQRIWEMTPGEGWDNFLNQTDGEPDGSAVADPNACRCHVFRHTLPGHPACYVELQTPSLDHSATPAGQSVSSANLPGYFASRFEIVSEVLADGWAKSMADWQKQNELPIRFNPPVSPSPSYRTRML